MEKVMKGKVTYERVSDTGDPYFDFEHKIGYDSVPNLEDELGKYEGRRVKLTVIIEEIDEDEEDDFED